MKNLCYLHHNGFLIFEQRLVKEYKYVIVVYLTSSCVIWAFFGMSGLV
jgi:hypothetical protein